MPLFNPSTAKPPFLLAAGDILGEAAPSGSTIIGTDGNGNPGMIPVTGTGSFLFSSGGAAQVSGLTVTPSTGTLTIANGQTLTVTTGGTLGTGAYAAAFNPAIPGAIGGTTPGAGTFTTLVGTTVNGLTITTSTGTLTIPNGVVLTGPSASGTAATLSGTQTFSGATTFSFSGAAITVGASITLNSNGYIQGTSIVASQQLQCGGSNVWLYGNAGAGRLSITSGALGALTALQLGGFSTSATYPAIIPSGTTLQIKLGDSSAFTFLQAQLQTSVAATTGLTAGVLSAITNSSLVIYDSTGQAYRVPCII